MIKIKNVDEKKMIVAYLWVKNVKHFKSSPSMEAILNTWKKWWDEDFKDGEKFLNVRVHDNKIVKTKRSAKMGKEQGEIYDEYTSFFHEIKDWIDNVWDLRRGRKENIRRVREPLMEHRDKCHEELIRLFEGSLFNRDTYSLEQIKNRCYRVWEYSITKTVTDADGNTTNEIILKCPYEEMADFLRGMQS